MRKLGGVATFGQLNLNLDFSSWKTKTPEASVRRIVQVSNAFFKIQPGLWALEESKNEVLKKFDLHIGDKYSENAFTHTYYQGLLVEIGNLRNKATFVSNQDKNKLFLQQALKDISTLTTIYKFTYDEILRFAKTIDVAWFNERKMPSDFFEVEHTTDIKNSLSKFFELQDFSSNFYIVAPEYKKIKFTDYISLSIYSPIKDRVKFVSYEQLADMHTQEHKKLKYF